MNCRETLNLISAYLDGMLSVEELADFERHLADCPACAHELAVFQRISSTFISAAKEEVTAPPELCKAVMNTLRAEERGTHKKLHKLPVNWQRMVAAAAAILLLVGSSTTASVGLKMAAGSFINQVASVFRSNDSTNSPINIANSTPTGDTGTNLGSSNFPNTPGLSDPNASLDKANSGNKTIGNNQSAANNSLVVNDQTGGSAAKTMPEDEPVVLLNNNELKVNSTLLKLSVPDLDLAKAKSVSLAANNGATTQVFPEQADGKRILVLRMTTEAEQARRLVTNFANLGTTIEQQNESRDLTASYNETAAQYREVQAQWQKTTDPTEQQQLADRADALKQQLDAWQDEAGKQVIVLWLESE